MGNKIKCTCGHSWNKSDSSKKDATVCHICGKDNEMENGGWLDKYEQGGMVLKQKTNDNYGKKDNPNDVEVSVGDDYVGLAYDTTGRNYSPAWGGQFQKGGFLQPTSSKLPEGYVIPYSTPSTELSVSIGGEDGEPAYLIPSFKYGKKLKDPIDEYRKTGEHLGGPFKTLQEAEKFGEMRHKYVEKGQDIPTPLKTWGDMAMGGTIPGSVGFTYARTGDTPSEGPYAKKTLPSAQNGQEMQYYQEGLDWKPKNISRNGGWLDAYDVPKAEDGFETDCGVGYYKDANGNCVSLTSRNQQPVVTESTRIPQRDYELENKIKVRNAIANQPQFSQGRVLTPYEEAVNAQKNKNYVQKTPNAQLVDGEIRQRNLDRSLEGKPLTALERKQDASLERVMNSLDAAGAVTGVGALTSMGYNAAKKALIKSSQEGLLSNAYKINPSNVKQSGFFNFKGAFQKYPKGPLTQEEIAAYKNSQEYQQFTQEHLNSVKKYGDNWKLPNYVEDNLQEAISTGNRNRINPTLYGGNNWNALNYIMAGVAGTAYPGVAGLYGLAFSPPAVKSKVLKNIGIQGVPGGLSSKDTAIDLTNRNMDFAKVNETKDGQIIIGGEFIEDANNTVRKAKDWITATDTYSDKEYSSKDVQSFYGIENGKFKVGKASEFNPNTELVPRRFGEASIDKAVMNGNEMRILDKEGKPIYQNTPNTGKFILYSPSTGKAQFTYINTGKSGVDKVNSFLKKNKDAQYIHLDNGRYEYYGLNPEGLTEQDFKNYYEQDLKREGNPGYNLIIKEKGGVIKDDRGQWDHEGEVTRISGGNITMRPDPMTGKPLTQPLLGISDTGEEQMMYPGQDYNFEGANYVTEYPKGKRPKKAKNGVNQADENSLVQLDQLTNFTNYNKPTKGGWLDKY